MSLNANAFNYVQQISWMKFRAKKYQTSIGDSSFNEDLSRES